MSYIFKDAVGKIYFLCWSCGDFMSEDNLNESDGFCPRCSAELDLSESPYIEDIEKFREGESQ